MTGGEEKDLELYGGKHNSDQSGNHDSERLAHSSINRYSAIDRPRTQPGSVDTH